MKWEYKVEYVGSVAFSESNLNRTGKEGWELVGMYESSSSWYAVFKRPKA